MALTAYKKKRTFSNTPEPTGGKGSRSKLHFVVQKHAASSLHYDFRLEMKGVLKSWAVPKGPSMDPADKRLAMLVEDHPYDYRNFEGNIPAGNYGAGTVMIWDHGTYGPSEDVKHKSAREKILLKGFQSGTLKFRLDGGKLRGDFVLIRTPKRADNAWLLIKQRDEHATSDDITLLDQSVVSGKTMDEISDDTEHLTSKIKKTPAKKAAKARGKVKH